MLLGFGGCNDWIILQSSLGRKRYNVPGAYSNRDTSLIAITNEDYINSDTIVELLIKINNAHPVSNVTLVMDDARYQRCNKVMDKAKDLGIHLLFLLPYSPNLNLIERLLKFTKKKCLYNKYYESFHHYILYQEELTVYPFPPIKYLDVFINYNSSIFTHYREAGSRFYYHALHHPP